MNLRHSSTFQAVVSNGGFLRAAEALNCAQSTVTLHVQQLEAELRVELFVRQGRSVHLTEAGRVLHEQAGAILDRVIRLEETMAEVGAGKVGQVRLGAIEPTASLRLPPIIVRFCRERPRIRLTLEVGGTGAISHRVATGDLDVGVCSLPAARLGLSFEPLFAETLKLLVPTGHPLAVATTVRAEDLTAHRLILSDQGCGYRGIVEQALERSKADPVTGIDLGSIEAIKRAVQGGLGVAIIPEAAADPAPPDTVLRSLEDIGLRLTVGLVRRADAGPVGRALETLVAALRSQLPVYPGVERLRRSAAG